MIKWLMKKAENAADDLIKQATENFNKSKTPNKKDDNREVKHPK